MVKIIVNDYKFVCSQKITLLNLCRLSGLSDYKFCYHENLPIAGNCRICLIEVEEMDKQIAACATNVEPNSSIWTENVFCKKARENVVGTLLINHPLDCPICDQGGDCDLQDQVRMVGSFKSRFYFSKRIVKDKNCGIFINTIMTRCIHCLRCVRFNKLIGERNFGVLNRSSKSEIVHHSFDAQNFDFRGVTVDLCPVGALTSRSYTFKCRPWELKLIESLDVTDSLGANLYIHYKESEIFRITPKSNIYVNGNLISDRIRFSLAANTFNRVKVVFKQNLKKKIDERIDWFKFFGDVKKLIYVSPITILVNGNLDLETHFYLKKLSYTCCEKIRIASLNNSLNSNFHYYGFSNFLFNLETLADCCFFFGTQPQVECSILNLKLRLHHKKTLFSLFSCGRFFNDTFELSFLNLNIKKLVTLLECKLKDFSVKFILFLSILIFFNKSFSKNICDIDLWSSILKKKLKSLKIVEVTFNANSEGLKISNTMLTIKQKFKSLLFCLNMEDNLKLRHTLLKIPGEVFWFTTHKPLNFLVYQYIVPVASFVESENILLNIEKRIQKTQRILAGVPSILNVLKSIFNIEKCNIFLEYFYLNFFIELLNNTKKNFGGFLAFNNMSFDSYSCCNRTIIKLVILKSAIENNFCSSIWTKNSNFLNQAFILRKKKAKTFFLPISARPVLVLSLFNIRRL